MQRPRSLEEHTNLICSVGEMSGLFAHSTNIESFLQKIAEMIAQHMHSDVCSIYLYYSDKKELVLKATKGLNVAYINNVKLKLGEGLTGLALKEMRPIREKHASQNPNFRYFPGLGEENFESFLATPIVRGTRMIGAMVIQNSARNYFTAEDEAVLRAIASQLANTIETTRLILSIEEKPSGEEVKEPRKDITLVKGKVGATGFALGEAIIIESDKGLKSLIKKREIKQYTLENFYHAVKQAEKQLEEHQQQIEEKLADVASLIFMAQILMLKDQGFIDSIVQLINEGKNPPEAIIDVCDEYIQRFQKLTDAYLQEKAQDVRDIGIRLLENLMGKEDNPLDLTGRIVIATELLPSDALKLYSQKVKGIILLTGGVTSHLSILSRSLGIPLMIADEPQLLALPQRTEILMDAQQGNIYINPSADTKKTFQEKEDARLGIEQSQENVLPQTRTKDGVRVQLLANINLLGDVDNARGYKAEGIGLYRTEFPFVVRNDFPSEEEQHAIYKKLVNGMPDKEITFRTLDIGGDKVLSYFDHHLKEKNPYLGMRSIRFSLQHIDIFAQQIRAVLRAGMGADIRIMFPMISSLDEFRQAKDVVIQCIDQLKASSIPCHDSPQIGLMIELPSVMEIIDELAREADFFSIGTNDFIQYMLAVDRTNEKVADLYIPHHPSILRALRKVVVAAQKRKKDVSICGDMAHDARYLPYLLGIGVRKFSVNPILIPRVQKAIQSIEWRKACKEVKNILKENTLAEIIRLMKLD